jgi:hypothetical protein
MSRCSYCKSSEVTSDGCCASCGYHNGTTDEEFLKLCVEYSRLNTRLSDFRSPVRICINTGVHVFKGIERLAKAAGAALTLEVRDEAMFWDRVSFMYEGIEFFELKEKENKEDE